MLNSKYIKWACLDTWLLVNTVKTQTADRERTWAYLINYALWFTLYTFLTGRGGELFPNTWVGWEGWGPLTDTHLSDIELFTTLFIQDKQLPPPLDFFYWAQVSTYRCLMAKTKCWKWYSSVVWMSVLNLWWWWIYVEVISCCQYPFLSMILKVHTGIYQHETIYCYLHITL